MLDSTFHNTQKRNFRKDPFESIDRGVQELVKIGVERGRSEKTTLKISVCGEHGGDPNRLPFSTQNILTLFPVHPFECQQRDWQQQNSITRRSVKIMLSLHFVSFEMRITPLIRTFCIGFFFSSRQKLHLD